MEPGKTRIGGHPHPAAAPAVPGCTRTHGNVRIRCFAVNLLLRTLWLLFFGARRRAACPALGPCRTPFRVRPLDLDILGHMNNGRYLSVMDLARMDLMVRSGWWRRLRAGGIYPVLVAETIQFRRSLQARERYEIETTLPGWDQRDCFGVQRFRRGDGEIVATAVIRARFLRREPGGSRPVSVPRRRSSRWLAWDRSHHPCRPGSPGGLNRSTAPCGTTSESIPDVPPGRRIVTPW